MYVGCFHFWKNGIHVYTIGGAALGPEYETHKVGEVISFIGSTSVGEREQLSDKDLWVSAKACLSHRQKLNHRCGSLAKGERWFLREAFLPLVTPVRLRLKMMTAGSGGFTSLGRCPTWQERSESQLFAWWSFLFWSASLQSCPSWAWASCSPSRCQYPIGPVISLC